VSTSSLLVQLITETPTASEAAPTNNNAESRSLDTAVTPLACLEIARLEVFRDTKASMMHSACRGSNNQTRQ
jgi:hypothetical protein